MKQIISKIKNYKPSKQILLLYIFIPIIMCAVRKLTIEEDIWFLLNHGKYVVNNGFPTIEPFTMHHGFNFVMQQWLSSVIFYEMYHLFGKYGLFIIIEVVVCIIMFLIYKLGMKLSDNRFSVSVLISVLSTTLLTLQIVPRPQIFTYINLLLLLYIMECFIKNKNTKLIYLLPLISLIQINLHASMWFMLYVFLLPYIVSLIYDFYKTKKSNNFFKLLGIIVFMFLCGFINPYGVNAIKYVFNSYGNYYINQIVFEMHPIYLDSTMACFDLSLFILIIIVSNITVYMLYVKTKISLRHFLLIYGVSFLGLINIRNYGLLIIGTIPFLSKYIGNSFQKVTRNIKNKKISVLINIVLIIITIFIFNISNSQFTSSKEKGIDKILESAKTDNVTLYTNYGNGSYAEYRGLKSYIDTRAEIFTKKFNKKEDIMEEYYMLCNGYLKYQDFVNKYKFTHMLIEKDELIYEDALKDEDYKIIYKNKEYVVLERKK